MKKKVAFYWCASCGGCEEAIVDLAEFLLEALEQIEIVFWPVAMDFKVEDVEKLNDGEIFAAFINGSVLLSDQEEVVRLLRRKSQVVVAFGSCAHQGGVPGLINTHQRSEVLDYYYHNGPTVQPNGNSFPSPENAKPYEVNLPFYSGKARPLNQVIDVDYYIPGCAPPPNVVKDAILKLLSDSPPPKGTVLAGQHSLCADCPLNETKPPEGFNVRQFIRPSEASAVDRNTCLLMQGLPCLGPVTRSGCNALCIKGHMPCTGCFGPLDGVRDFGAAALSFLASLIDSNDAEEIQRIIDEGLPDPFGTFYMYSFPGSLLHEVIQTGREKARSWRKRLEKETTEADSAQS